MNSIDIVTLRVLGMKDVCIQNNSQYRDEGVSIAKGIAIILMVVGHSLWINCYARSYIYMFHMPLFFFMSGFCFKEKYLRDFKTFFVRRIKSLWWPYFKYNIIFMAFHNLFWSLSLYSVEGFEHPYTFDEYFDRILHFLLMNGAEQFLCAYWFLNTLLAGSAIFIIFRTFIKPHYLLIILLVGTLILLLLCNYISGAFSIIRILYATAFITTGYLFSISSLRCRIGIPYILVFFVMIGIGTLFWPCEILAIDKKTFLPYFITAIAGCLMTLGCSDIIVTYNNWLKKILVFCGEHTMAVLTYHFLCFKVVTYIIIIVYGMPISKLGTFPILESQSSMGWWLAYAVIGVIGSLLLWYLFSYITIVNKFLLGSWQRRS